MHTRHFLQLIGMSALWGASFPLLRIASPALGPWLLAGLRCTLAAVVLAVLMRALRERWPPRAAWPRLALLSLLTVVTPFVLFNWAALVIPAGYSAVLNATAPLFGVLGAALAGYWFRQAPDRPVTQTTTSTDPAVVEPKVPPASTTGACTPA